VTDVFVNCRRIPEEQVLWLLQDQSWKYADAAQPQLSCMVFPFSDPPKATPLFPLFFDMLLVTPGLISVSTGSSYYISCDKLRVDHYQELIDRGWRR
jgi:hypothetical protein